MANVNQQSAVPEYDASYLNGELTWRGDRSFALGAVNCPAYVGLNNDYRGHAICHSRRSAELTGGR